MHEEATIIKKKKKHGHEGHHGGAWKVAYADFVTAMMAFFLLLWILGMTNAQQKKGIADYFTPTALTQSSVSGAGQILGGTQFAEQGNLKAGGLSPREAPGATESFTGREREVRGTLEGSVAPQQQGPSSEASGLAAPILTETQPAKPRLDEAERRLREALAQSAELRGLASHLIIEQTSEGLRIQLVDRDNRPMFPLGGATMYDYTQEILAAVAGAIKDIPNKISITGHTDATPFVGGRNRSNWELSLERANASRLALVSAGVKEDRFSLVSGAAATQLLVPNEPAAPANRRVSILLLRGANEPFLVPGPPAAPAPPARPAPGRSG
ncbi:MAG: flagellar motor protein MotB [Proteobacteria bacterium]|nr:flagellar motor protein MotB [Pseudomonadota bacterium]